MRKLILSMAAISLLAISCKKSSSTSTPPATTIPSNGWKLGTTSYSTVIATKLGANLISAFDGMPSGSTPAVNSFNVYFSALPTAGGTFHIKSYPSVLASNEIGISAGLYATSTTYTTTGNDGIDATVTITGGKLKIVVPSVWVKKTSAADSLQLTGTLVEQ